MKVQFPQVPPEIRKADQPVQHRHIYLYIADRRQVWLDKDSVDWAVNYIFEQCLHKWGSGDKWRRHRPTIHTRGYG